MKVYIRAHAADGFSHVWRAKRAWASGHAHEVVVVDGDDPTVEERDPETKLPRQVPDPKRISKAEFEQLKQDPRISILQDPKAIEESKNAVDENHRLRARVAELEAQLAARGTGAKDDITAVGDPKEGHILGGEGKSQLEQKELGGTEGKDDHGRKKSGK